MYAPKYREYVQTCEYKLTKSANSPLSAPSCSRTVLEHKRWGEGLVRKECPFGLALFVVFVAPSGHLLQDRDDIAAFFGERVFGVRGNFGVGVF